MSKKRLTSNVIETVELCLRMSEDEFNNMGILRVDVGSDYEGANLCSRKNESNSESRFHEI